MSGHEGLGEEGQDAWQKRRRLKRSDAERDEIVRASFAPSARQQPVLPGNMV